MGDLALCGFCRKFEFEDESGYGFCSRDGEVAEYRRMPQFRGILREKEAPGLK